MNKDVYHLKLALQAAEASKCQRAKYGAVLVSADGRVVATAYNGKPKGSCNDDVCHRLGLPDNHPRPNCCIHSETNLLLFSSPQDRIGATIFVCGLPCTDCLLLIFQTGIVRVVYLDGAASSGHRGNFSFQFIEDYGFKDKIEFCPIDPKVVDL